MSFNIIYGYGNSKSFRDQYNLLQFMLCTHLNYIVLEGNFLTRYFASIGDFSLLGGGSDLINEFISDFRDNLEFDPDDDDEDEEEDSEEETDGGFNIRGFLRNVVSQLEDRAVQQFAQQSAELGQCIRQVVEV